MLIGNGTARAAIVKGNKILDLVPVDYVVDVIICAAWHATLHRNSELKVYNCTSNAHSIR